MSTPSPSRRDADAVGGARGARGVARGAGSACAGRPLCGAGRGKLRRGRRAAAALRLRRRPAPPRRARRAGQFPAREHRADQGRQRRGHAQRADPDERPHPHRGHSGRLARLLFRPRRREGAPRRRNAASARAAGGAGARVCGGLPTADRRRLSLRRADPREGRGAGAGATLRDWRAPAFRRGGVLELERRQRGRAGIRRHRRIRSSPTTWSRPCSARRTPTPTAS